ncbi:MAG: hypothetical protein VB094_00560 [Oscillibacter sp.]|nr:hypothetical protein [Oscillibacter sp.]
MRMLTIGVFTSQMSETVIKQALESMECTDYQLVYRAYDSQPQLGAFYQKEKARFDGLIFSGLHPYNYICNRFGKPRVPCVYIELTHRDYYRTLLQVVYHNPRLDVRRIWLDRPMIEIPWDYIFGEGIRPQTDFDPRDFYDVNSDSIYDNLTQKYLQVYRDHQVDFIITRMNNLACVLQREGIPYTLLLPSPDTVRETVERFLQELRLQRYSDSLTVVGKIQPGQAMDSPEAEEFHHLLRRFNMAHGNAAILHHAGNCFEVITSKTILENLTSSYTHSMLSEYLKQNAQKGFSIGWGVGTSITQAQQNAERALDESRRSAGHGTYLISETDQLVGPLGEKECAALSILPGREAQLLAKLLKMSVTNAQKLLTVTQAQSSFRMDRNSLSRLLNTSVRTANRILTRMVELNAAQVVGSEQHSSAGRPITVYEIDLRKLVE